MRTQEVMKTGMWENEGPRFYKNKFMPRENLAHFTKINNENKTGAEFYAALSSRNFFI